MKKLNLNKLNKVNLNKLNLKIFYRKEKKEKIWKSWLMYKIGI